MTIKEDAARGRDIVLALSGGVGGAKLALGLSHACDPAGLAVAVNTGDDFRHLGLHVSPDIDTVMYTLAGLANPELGWGRRDESWTFMGALKELGGPDWFMLGDRDLATNVLRTNLLASGATLSAVTASFCERLGIAARILPVTDDPLRTRVRAAEGWLDFQDYFVRLRCAPAIDAVAFEGAGEARLNPAIEALFASGRLRAVVLCPSNPFVSIEPMLAVGPFRDLLRSTPAPVVAVSPIIGGEAVKGPAAKMLRELGVESSAEAALSRYADFLDGAVVDTVDAAASLPDMAVHATRTLMVTLEDRVRLARETLAFADSIAKAGPR